MNSILQRSLLRLSSITLSFLISFSLFADTISIRADYWCPYNCNPDSDRPGYIIEAAKLIFSKAGHTIDYKTINWDRTIKEVGLGTFDGAVGAAKSEVPNFVFPQISQGKANLVFTTKADLPWKYKGESSLKGISIGLNAGYAQGDEINALVKKYPQNFQFAKGENPVRRNLRKLLAGRIQAIFADENVIRYSADKMSISDQIKTAGTVKTLSPNDNILYIAFSPKNPKSAQYAEILSKGWEAIRESGELETILKKYSITDWI